MTNKHTEEDDTAIYETRQTVRSHGTNPREERNPRKYKESNVSFLNLLNNNLSLSVRHSILPHDGTITKHFPNQISVRVSGRSSRL